MYLGSNTTQAAFKGNLFGFVSVCTGLLHLHGPSAAAHKHTHMHKHTKSKMIPHCVMQGYCKVWCGYYFKIVSSCSCDTCEPCCDPAW